MQKIIITQKAIDETQTLLQVVKDLPDGHAVAVKHQTEIITDLLTDLYSILTEENLPEIQKETQDLNTPEPGTQTQQFAGDLLNELENQNFENSFKNNSINDHETTNQNQS